MKAFVVAVTLVAGAQVAAADPTTDAQVAYHRAVDRYLTSHRADMARAQETTTRVDQRTTPLTTGDRASARARALEPDNASAAIDRASAAIKTGLADVEAGIQLAPLVLAGRTSPAARGWSVTIAALKESRFRIGTAYRLALDTPAVGPRDLGFADCAFDATAAEKSLTERATDFVSVCGVVASFPPPSPATEARRDWIAAAAACGAASPPNLTAPEAALFVSSADGDVFVALAQLNAFMTGPATTATGDAAIQVAGAKEAAGRLQALADDPPSRTQCRSNDVIAAAVARHKWQQRNRAIGVSVAADFFPIVGGFDVDPATPDPAGELAQIAGQAEFRYARNRLSWALGFGAKGTLASPAADREYALTPTVRIDFVLARLDGEKLLDDHDAITLADGKLPPLLTVGVDLTAAIPLDPSPTHDKTLDLIAFDKMTATLFADFRFTDELAFRLGIPFSRDAATRDSDGKRALVWTVPVFLTTVLKL